jgi:hypothetical protein
MGKIPPKKVSVAFFGSEYGDTSLSLGTGDAVAIDPTNEMGTGSVQDKTKIGEKVAHAGTALT